MCLTINRHWTEGREPLSDGQHCTCSCMHKVRHHWGQSVKVLSHKNWTWQHICQISLNKISINHKLFTEASTTLCLIILLASLQPHLQQEQDKHCQDEAGMGQKSLTRLEEGVAKKAHNYIHALSYPAIGRKGVSPGALTYNPPVKYICLKYHYQRMWLLPLKRSTLKINNVSKQHLSLLEKQWHLS